MLRRFRLMGLHPKSRMLRHSRMLKNTSFFTRPALARRDAPFPRRRSRLVKILNVPHSENKLSWQLGEGE